ncbi:MAG: hypothetical protein RL071_2284 [Pseudomonadota bacterium]
MLGLLLVLGALAQAPGAPGAPDPAAARKAWMVGIARMEGASADVEAAAGGLAAALRAAGEGGRVQRLPAVHTRADELHRLVLSADLAARNLRP